MCPSSTSHSEGEAPIDAHGLVQIDPGRATCAAGARTRWLVLALFTAGLAGSALVDRAAPLAEPRLVGQEAAAEARLRSEARLRDGSLARVFERHLRLTSRLRSWVTPLYGATLYRFLGITKPDVLTGRDGWLFRADRIGDRSESLAPRIRLAEDRVAGLDAALRARGTRLVVALIPRRSEIHADLLPRGLAPSVGHEALVAALRARGVEVVDLLPPFRDHRGPPLFHRRDTHWNDLGMSLAAERIAVETGLLAPPERRLHRLVAAPPEPEKVDLLPGVGVLDGAEWRRVRWLLPRIETPALHLVDDRGRPVDTLPRPDWPPRIALAGTSFSAGNRFASYLSHFTGSVVANEAMRGTGPSVPMLRLSERIRVEGGPEVVLWEIPAHTLLDVRRPLARVDEAIAVLSSPAGPAEPPSGSARPQPERAAVALHAVQPRVAPERGEQAGEIRLP